MSLLGTNVYANPNTPLWSGGGGSNLPENPTFNIVTFEPSGSPPYSSTGIGTVLGVDVGSAVSILGADQTELGPLQATALYAGVEANYPRVIYQSDGIDYQDADTQSYFLASVNSGSNGWDLPTVSSLGYTKFTPSTVSIPLATVDTSANRWNLSNVASLVVDPNVGVPPLTIGLGGTSTTLGIRRDEEGKETDYITFAPAASEMDLSNVSSINGAPYPPAIGEVSVIKTGILNFSGSGSVTFSTPFAARPTITLQATILPPWSGSINGSGLFYIVSADANGFVVGFEGTIAFYDPIPLMWMAVGS